METRINKIINDKKYYNVIIYSIFALFLFLHIFRLGNLPSSINIDEAGLWYNIKSLLNFGVDQGDNSWPLLFTNYYSEQSAMYTYLAFLCVKLFGDTLFAIRLPAAVFSCLIFVFGYKIINHLYKNNKINLLFCAICTISPYFISSFRIALDCNLMLCFSTMFLWFFIQAIESKRYSYSILAGVVGGLTLYTYGLSYVIMPIFLIVSLVYLIYYKKINFKQAIAFTVPLVILAIPLIIVQVINVFDLNEIVIGNITLTKFARSRHLDFSLKQFFTNITIVPLKILFGTGMIADNISYSNFYPISVCFIICGIFSIIKKEWKNIRNKVFSWQFILSYWGISSFLTALMVNGKIFPHQSNAIFFIITWLIIEGILDVYHIISLDKFKKIFVIALVILYVAFFVLFGYSYFYGCYNQDYYKFKENFGEYNLEPALEIIKNDSTVVFNVDKMYYKLITAEHPTVHPHIYQVTWVEKFQQEMLTEKIYSYENGFIFIDELESILSDNTDKFAKTTFVSSKKDAIEMESWLNESHIKIELENYIIFRPKQ